jgi:hypothetical protein
MTPTSPAAEWRSAALMLVGPCVVLMSIAIARGPFDLGRHRPTPSWLLLCCRSATRKMLVAGQVGRLLNITGILAYRWAATN